MWKKLNFCYPWRPYQARVLQELDDHLMDKTLNVVAAPGSGKTILGLEAMKRLAQPTLIFSPTLAIRNQWYDRLTTLFWPSHLSLADLKLSLSLDLYTPKQITFTTFQALHALQKTNKPLPTPQKTIKKESSTSAYQRLKEPAEHQKHSSITVNPDSPYQKVLTQLRSLGLKTIIIDEAHHIRNSWWESLTSLIKEFPEVHVIALTATPPYDVSPQEWQRYQRLCGHIDAEISVPELVASQTLCPHQDYIYFNLPNEHEQKALEEFHQSVQHLQKELLADQELIAAVQKHILWQTIIHYQTSKQEEKLLENSTQLSSLALYLNATGQKIPNNYFWLLGLYKKDIPDFDLEWTERFLSTLLYESPAWRQQFPQLHNKWKKACQAIGAIERKSLYLKTNKKTKKTLQLSLNKMISMKEIVELEFQNLGCDLRLVILADYIRQESLPDTKDNLPPLNRLGVVPIFEYLRRHLPKNSRPLLGVLTGSLTVLPVSSLPFLKKLLQERKIPDSQLEIETLEAVSEYCQVRLLGSTNHQMVELITEMFKAGKVQLLIGTGALLGEGWDAPVINSLILASYVGSFMLSNQMRGRAIRIDPTKPDKTANIWHLVSVDLLDPGLGPDYRTLRRRFRAFVGPSRREVSIENGWWRMAIPSPPYVTFFPMTPLDKMRARQIVQKKINHINKDMVQEAKSRKQMREKWEQALHQAKIKEVVQELRTPKKFLPRSFVISRTIKALLFYALGMSLTVFIVIHDFANQNLSIGVSLFALIVSLLAGSPWFFRALYLFVRHGPLASSMREVGNTVLWSLCQGQVIKTSYSKMRLQVQHLEAGRVSCLLLGSTTYEERIFSESLQEIFSPIANQRYLLKRVDHWGIWKRVDFIAVPQVLAAQKKMATLFLQAWKKRIGPARLIYTRHKQGRKALLQARTNALSSRLAKKSQRLSRWA